MLRVQRFATPWTVALQAPLSMGSSRQELWSGSSCPPPGDLPNPEIEPKCLKSPASCMAGRFFTSWATREAPIFQRTVAFLWKCLDLRVEGSEDSGATEIDDCERQHDRETIDELKFKPHISQLGWKLWGSSVYKTKSDEPSRWGEDVFSPTLPQGTPEQRQGIS